MKGTPEQIEQAKMIKAKTIDMAFTLIRNPQTRELLANFADSKQNAQWWVTKWKSGGDKFLITEHQQSLAHQDMADIPQNSGPNDQVSLNGFRLPQWMVDWLIRQPESAEMLIEKALLETYKIKPPGNQPAL